MSEAEDLLVEAAVKTTRAAHALWRRHTPRAERFGLSSVRTRLELLITAQYGACPAIVAAEPPPPRTLLRALAARRFVSVRADTALASTDGVRVRLPRTIEPSRGDAEDLALLRLLALEMAARVQRGSVRLLPGGALMRDLYALAEAAVIDAELARAWPGLASELAAERARILEARSAITRLSACEAAVEELAQSVLARPLELAAQLLERAPAASLAWAQQRARELSSLGTGYRGLVPIPLWGTMERPIAPAAGELAEQERPAARGRRVLELQRAPRARPAAEEQDARMGAFVVKPNATEQSVEDPSGLARPADRELEPDLDDIAQALSDLPEAQLVRSRTLAREALVSDDLPGHLARRPGTAACAARVYPEWNYREQAYRAAGATVREPPAVLGDAAASRAALARHALLVREVRKRFERLRMRHQRMSRQLDGDGVDLGAYVSGFADFRAGRAVDDRVYESSRRLRRELAACVLLDASASTDAWVTGSQRIIDIEKDALLVVSEAFELIGERYALLAFSGEGADGVDVVRLKSFEERGGELVRRRIAGLEPDRYTRAGAALRHATALLSEQPARHRLLLLLSDGKPNDIDAYEGVYGVEDVRQATIEARLAGIHVFCLAVDREAPRYASRIFGSHGFAVLRHPQRLPQALVELLRRLVAR